METNVMIKEIKKIIAQTGELSSGEMDLDCSPIYKAINDRVLGLVEHYKEKGVTVVVYAYDQEVDEFDLYYEQLPDDLLDDILNNLEDYLELENDLMDRCKDYNY